MLFSSAQFCFSVPIDTRLIVWEATSLIFEQFFIAVSYKIGSGMQILALPSPKERPDCNPISNVYKMKLIKVQADLPTEIVLLAVDFSILRTTMSNSPQMTMNLQIRVIEELTW